LIQMRSLMESAPVGAKIALPEVIGEKKDNVRFLIRDERCECDEEREEEKVAGFHEMYSSSIIWENLCWKSSITSSGFAFIRGYLRPFALNFFGTQMSANVRKFSRMA